VIIVMRAFSRAIVAICLLAGRVAAQGSTASLLPFDVLGAPNASTRGCSAAPYRQFDFWLGNWDVYGGKGKLAGTNVVKSKLGGCVVEENWTGGTLGRGRSLNFYDASTKTWSQMWVSSGGCPTGMIMYEGTFANGSMTLRGRREQPAGLEIGPPCGPTPPITAKAWTNLARWTVMPSGSVLQQGVAVPNDDTLPSLGPAVAGNGLRYDRVTTVTPIDSPDPSYCPNRKEAAQFDFMVGTWSVRMANGSGPAGTAKFSKDMQGCLVEEQFAGVGGYEGMSFNTFDPFTGKWLRTYVDTDGNRLVLGGGLQNGSMVLAGTKKAAGRDVDVRVTWKASSDGRVMQRWELSRDGGTQWTTVRELVYTRQ
jgi:hypothetical protein